MQKEIEELKEKTESDIFNLWEMIDKIIKYQEVCNKTILGLLIWNIVITLIIIF